MERRVCVKIAPIQESEDIMNLIDVAKKDFVVMNKLQVDDDYGSVQRVWTEGATIKGIMAYDSSTQMKVALAMGAKSEYNFIVAQNINLDYHTVLKRKSDGKIFRLTSNSDDLESPTGSPLNQRQYSAEEWRLE